MHLFIIPGNPPAVHFYKLWAEEIKHQLGECSVHISPYPNLPSHNDSYGYLKDMAATHANELLAFHQTVKNKVVVIGHSLGGWMALHLLQEHQAIIENCFLLHPFLLKPSLKGRAILKLIRVLHKTPRIEKMLLSSRGILEKFFKDLRYVTDEEIRVSLTLSYHEHEVIACCKKALEIPEKLQKKLHMIYCDQDTWCPPRSVEEIKKWISCEKIASTHSFITSPDQRALMLKSIWNRRSIDTPKQFLTTTESQ